MIPLMSLWGHLYGLYKLMYAYRERGRLWGEAGAGYLPGSNKVKALGEQSWFLLVDCFT